MEKCWFCETNSAEPDAAFEQKLHREIGREGGKFQRVDYLVQTVRVPRCTICKKQHSWQKVLIGIASIFLVGVGTLIYIFLGKKWWLALLGGIAAVAVITLIDFIIRSKKIPTFKTMKDQDAVRKYPRIKEMLDSGWGWGGAGKKTPLSK